MICYRDMTYCPYYTDCAHGDSCHRALTQEVMDAVIYELKKQWADI